MKKCPQCNEEYGDGATYCEKCGTKLVKYRTCQHCGALVDDEAVFCSKCGKAVDEIQEVVSDINSSRVEEKNLDSATIAQYKREIASYKSKRITMTVLGSVLLTLGLVFFILCIYWVSQMDFDAPDTSNQYMALWCGIVFSELAIDAGIALLIIQAAVFTKKISNRERAIDEFESRK